MSNKKIIEESLKSLILDDNREFVAMLSGEWGIGKTYFWHKFTKSDLKDKNVAYISLFGHNSLQDIKTNIIMTLSKTEKGKAIVGELLNSFRTSLGAKDADSSSGLSLSGSVVNSLISLIPEKDLQNTVICFDDFERLSNKVALKDVMGLISQFKEQKKCKIIMILNEGELSEIDQKIFSDNKEKIVDYNFHYMPSQQELFEAIKEDVDKIKFCEHQTIYDFFKKIDLNNIRIMKQALYQLNHFDFIKDYKLDNKVIHEFIEIALNLFVFKAKSNFSYAQFKEIVRYRTNEELKQDLEDMYNDKEIQTDELNFTQKEALKNYYDLGFIYLKNVLEFEIYTFLDAHHINKEKINTLITDANSNLHFKRIHADITEINLQYTYSLHHSDNETSRVLKQALETNKDELHNIFTYYEFKCFIDNLKKYGKVSLSSSNEEEILQNYIKFYIDNPDSNDSHGHDDKTYLENLINDYSWAIQYKEEYLKSILPTDITLTEIIANICNEHIYSDDNKRLLEEFQIDDFKQSLINGEPTDVINIIQAYTCTISGNDFKPIKTKIAQALKEVVEQNHELKRKVNMIHPTLNLEDYK